MRGGEERGERYQGECKKEYEGKGIGVGVGM